jgi:hypothetical protein
LRRFGADAREKLADRALFKDTTWAFVQLGIGLFLVAEDGPVATEVDVST